MRRKLARLFPDEAGAAMLEFAICLPFLMVLILGVVELGGAIWQTLQVNSPAEAGLLYATKNGWCGGTNCSTTTSAQISSAATNAGLSNTTATTPSCSYGCPASSSPFAITFVSGRCGIDTPPTCGDGYPARQYVTLGANLSRTSFVTGGTGILNLSLPDTVTGTSIVRVK